MNWCMYQNWTGNHHTMLRTCNMISHIWTELNSKCLPKSQLDVRNTNMFNTIINIACNMHHHINTKNIYNHTKCHPSQPTSEAMHSFLHKWTVVGVSLQCMCECTAGSIQQPTLVGALETLQQWFQAYAQAFEAQQCINTQPCVYVFVSAYYWLAPTHHKHIVINTTINTMYNTDMVININAMDFDTVWPTGRHELSVQHEIRRHVLLNHTSKLIL